MTMMTTMVHVKEIWKSLGSRLVLSGASLSIEPGDRIVLLGENGSGKSTLLATMVGVLALDQGSITIAKDVVVGYAPEKPDLPEHLLVSEWMNIVSSLNRKQGRHPPLSSLTSSTFAFGVDEIRHKMMRALSLGQKQRVSLAAAWRCDPDLLVLDEPTNGLDIDAQRELLTRLNARSTTAQSTIIATHDRDFAAQITGKRVIEMHRGRLTRYSHPSIADFTKHFEGSISE